MSQVFADSEVLIRTERNLGRITLNRPSRLHALTETMCATMTEALLAWRSDLAIAAILLDHAGARGFCAGGDIRVLANSSDGVAARSFFFTEYRLNDLLSGYPKPIIAMIDGITMGGGAGISMPARYRVATGRTTFAMPETSIGMFPDVGGGWFLPRLPGKSGLWLALTGSRLKAADCLALGIATHFIESGRIESLKMALADEPSDIDEVLAGFASDSGPAPIAPHREAIDRLFAGDHIEAIMAALAADSSEWARAQRELIAAMSPQMLKVTFRQLELGAQMSRFSDNMRMEFRLALRVVKSHDFREGVRALLIDKDNAPKWNPSSVEGVTESMVAELFAPLPPNEEWSPLPQGQNSTQRLESATPSKRED